jgi:hypothetical protein
MQQVMTFAQADFGRNVEVSVISASSVDDLKRFPTVPFNLVADPDYELFRKYGAFDQEPKHATIVRDAASNELLRHVGGRAFMDAASVAKALAADPGVAIAP